jgi:hypothetical protein
MTHILCYKYVKKIIVMTTKEFINLICPEHTRTSCSDDNISNGFYFEEDRETISPQYFHRCGRCASINGV